jgi:regulator of protease activity HflC (stomatin/prohibitin superfamily)
LFSLVTTLYSFNERSLTMWTTHRIRNNELGLWFRHDDLYKVLTGGARRLPAIWPWSSRDRIEIVDTLTPRFEHEQIKALVQNSMLGDLLEVVSLRKREIALVWVDNRLTEVLEDGRHAFWAGSSRVDVVDTLTPRFVHTRLRVLVEDERLASRLTVIDLKDDERALVWIDGRLDAVLTGGLHAYWKDGISIKVERFSVNDIRFEHPKIESVLQLGGSPNIFTGIRVESHEQVLVFRDGELIEQMGAGLIVFWKGGSNITWKSVDMREQIEDIQGQEILSADKVSLRVNLVVTHRVLDPLKAVSEVSDWAQALYREAQLALRTAIGGRTLERLLADKDEVSAEIVNVIAPKAAAFGVTVSGVGLRDVILPGDMKTILNEVIIAQKQAEANLIRRREETAAARSQANTAKLLAENPVLARMKELEALQEIMKGTQATFVLGSGDLSDQIGSLIRREQASTNP